MVTKRSDLEDNEVEEVELKKPTFISHDYHREDLNELRDAVNYLISK